MLQPKSTPASGWLLMLMLILLLMLMPMLMMRMLILGLMLMLMLMLMQTLGVASHAGEVRVGWLMLEVQETGGAAAVKAAAESAFTFLEFLDFLNFSNIQTCNNKGVCTCWVNISVLLKQNAAERATAAAHSHSPLLLSSLPHPISPCCWSHYGKFAAATAAAAAPSVLGSVQLPLPPQPLPFKCSEQRPACHARTSLSLASSPPPSNGSGRICSSLPPPEPLQCIHTGRLRQP
jgi:hypothetical protein